ncbi:MAG: Gfo/Idh/MocA family oxidoreductase [Planctomycetota bacterium]
MIRIAVIGAGGMAAQRAGIFASLPSCRVVCVSSRNLAKAKTLADAVGAKATDDYARVLPEADALVLCVPNHLHFRLAREALAAGKHVLVEYPLCITSDEADGLRRAAGESGKVLMVGNTIRHEAPFRYLERRRDRLGTILSAGSRVAFYHENLDRGWYLDPAQTGPVFGAFHYHHIEYYRFFLGEAQWVLARDESRPGSASAPLLTAGGTLVMGHAGGATSCTQWYLSAVGDGLARVMSLTGTHGSVTVLSEEKGKSRAVWAIGEEGEVETFDDDWGVGGSCEEFLDAVAGKFDHRERFESDMRTLTLAFAADLSARRGEVVPV